MKLIRKFKVEEEIDRKDVYERVAARGIVVDGSKILLMYTKRYNDYSFPGGGVDKGEDIEEGLKREIEEETGARNIKILSEYGIYDETKKINRTEYTYINMISHFYICSVDKKLGKNKLEDYEIKNGMEARWVEIDEAIEHNKKVMEDAPSNMGLYIDRELYVLEEVRKNIIKGKNKSGRIHSL